MTVNRKHATILNTQSIEVLDHTDLLLCSSIVSIGFNDLLRQLNGVRFTITILDSEIVPVFTIFSDTAGGVCSTHVRAAKLRPCILNAHIRPILRGLRLLMRDFRRLLIRIGCNHAVTIQQIVFLLLANSTFSKLINIHFNVLRLVIIPVIDQTQNSVIGCILCRLLLRLRLIIQALLLGPEVMVQLAHSLIIRRIGSSNVLTVLIRRGDLGALGHTDRIPLRGRALFKIFQQLLMVDVGTLLCPRLLRFQLLLLLALVCIQVVCHGFPLPFLPNFQMPVND